MTEEIPAGHGIATLVIAMPGSVRPPTEAPEAMIRWLSRHGAPRTAEVLERLQHHGWTITAAEPDAGTQTAMTARAGFPDVGQARAAARAFHGRVEELMRWEPADRPNETHLVRFNGDVAPE